VLFRSVLQPNVTIAGVVSMFNIVEVDDAQGDATNAGIRDYLKNILIMARQFRKDLSMDSLPYIHSDYPVLAGNPNDATDRYRIDGTNSAGVKELIRQNKLLTDSLKYSVLIPTQGLTIWKGDGMWSHYDSAGNAGWGARVADSILAHKWGPPKSTSQIAQTVFTFSKLQHSMSKVLFNGSNWSAFDNAGTTFNIYMPNGKAILGTSAAALKTKNLLPGVYFVRAQPTR
jgi:hypothetical protein